MSTITSTGAATAGANKTIGKDEFFKMLIAQLKNQNPLSPLDGADFAAQLAQFSTVEKLGNISDQMDVLSAFGNYLSGVQTAGLIGNEVTAEGDQIQLNGETSRTINYMLSANVQKGAVSIFDSSGALVKTIEFGSQNAGMNSVTWNCSGQSAGTYNVAITAFDKNGAGVNASSLVTGVVDGVLFRDGLTYVTVNGMEITPAGIISVKKPASS
ncbi:MAG: flagellar hook capping FlgD N-terminal domain-containing protein [Syntrophales bacterium]|nr:flagellar hook capping FlgD N-terminal domain-containing protein [Syntrophales bacterium]MDD5231814.1 flagellar hook capping FlgD N-terminal domain-containing protein [Syntrophales bacterium]MDD5531204.1 flagellar hook capping FlgD N-terminal domain-containing protein [Syntrophales bacterium]